MAQAKARPDLQAYDKATRLAFPQVVGQLSEILGPKLVAYIAGVTETRAVRRWTEEGRQARSNVQQRLRTALRLALFLRDYDSPEVVQAWFQGLNPQLNDRSPARMLREGNPEEVGPEVLAAARAFVIGG